MIAPLSTNGLVPAVDFPTGPYEAIHGIVGKMVQHALYEDYAAAWNAVAYRFHAAVEAGEAFEQSLKADGATPLPAQRYKQDKALAHFFADGHSTFESVFYALYAIAAFVEPTRFSLATPADRRKVSPPKTETAFVAAFPGDPILLAISALFADPAYLEWQRIRNVLTHRAAPGRMMYVGIGNDDAPATEWKLDNIPLDNSLIPTRRAALARALAALLGAIETFVRAKV
ncbi:MAG: hypothetical protein Q8R82_20430 [Hyphomonadaceae bacterium]|nr:hypothetical protein [Hyphomonadaceae bacterium]